MNEFLEEYKDYTLSEMKPCLDVLLHAYEYEKEKAIFFILVLANSLLYVSNSSSVISKRRAVEMITSAEGSFGFE